MCKTFWQGTLMALALTMAALPGLSASSPLCGDLNSFLQAELSEVATLTAQMNSLQQCDPLGAALLASYIPDHQQQANALAAYLTAQGCLPGQICPISPCLGTREQIIQNDIGMFMQTSLNYACLKQNSCDPVVAQIAAQGWYAAFRHMNSLKVALASTQIDPCTTMDGLIAQLSLVRSAICDLQIQSARLAYLGDPANACKFASLIPGQQQQAAALEGLIIQMCGRPDVAEVPPTYTLATRDEILCHERIVETQFVNTYAIPIATLPPSPLRDIAAQTQTLNLAGLTLAQALTTSAVAIVPAPTETASTATTLTATATVPAPSTPAAAPTQSRTSPRQRARD